MAKIKKNDLIGYDPLAWMAGNPDNNEEVADDPTSGDDSIPEGLLLNANKIIITSDSSDDLIAIAEKTTVLKLAEEDKVIEEVEEVKIHHVPVEEMASTAVSKESDGAQIDLDSTLSIQNVVKLHERLKNVLAVHEQIEINASDVSSIDTATLQLLVSLKKNAVKLKKKVSIIYPSPRFVESAQLLGLLDVLDVHDV